MALALDGETYEAIQRLRNDSNWRRFVACVEDCTNRFFHQALDAPAGDQRTDNIAYARAFRDLLVVISAAEQNTGPGHVMKPPVVRRERAHA